MDDSVFITEEMPDVEVEFTPDLTWKGKARDSDNYNGNQRIKGIATPVIKSLESVLQLEIPNARGSYESGASAHKTTRNKL